MRVATVDSARADALSANGAIESNDELLEADSEMGVWFFMHLVTVMISLSFG
jgi:hypothetical protein